MAVVDKIDQPRSLLLAAQCINMMDTRKPCAHANKNISLPIYPGVYESSIVNAELRLRAPKIAVNPEVVLFGFAADHCCREK